MTTTNSVKTKIDRQGVATITLNREHKHNAFDEVMIAELTHAFNEVSNSSAKVMVLDAKGKNFSAGADLSWMQRMVDYSYEENLTDAKLLALMLKTLNEIPMPTIAKVNGGVFGGAVGLVCCCDIAIGSERSLFCLSEVKIGLIPATISPYVIAAIGQRASRRYFQTAERVDANTALRLGFLSELASSDELDEKTQKIVQQLLNNSPKALKAAKKLVSDVVDCPLTDELIDNTSARIAHIRTSEEGQEGLSAFLEKRQANWIRSD
jgi:methylglutaconyl-CoA hydratase